MQFISLSCSKARYFYSILKASGSAHSNLLSSSLAENVDIVSYLLRFIQNIHNSICNLKSLWQSILIIFGIFSCSLTNAASQPNIVVILTDDQGYGDVSYAGLASDLKTPSIDDLAAKGIKLDNFYSNSAVCSPTRASLMTGRFPGLVGVQGTVARSALTNMGYFSPNGPTLPEMLKTVGYHTGLIGKWHLGDYLGEDPINTPIKRGFDHFQGFIGAAGDYYTHDGSKYAWPGDNLMMLNDTVVEPSDLAGIHTTDLVTNWAKQYVKARSVSTQPFFLYLAYTAPHDPVQPPQAWLNKVLARESSIDPERAKLVALIEHMDDGIGQVIQTLKDTGKHDNTLIIFASDNGGYLKHSANNGPYRGGKLDLYEGGIKVPMVAVWPNKIAPGTSSSEMAATMDLYPTLAEVTGISIEHQIDGQSILPALLGQPGQVANRDLIFENRSTFKDSRWKMVYAVRRQNWKLVQNAPGGEFELYDLATDPYEQQNLASFQTAKFNELMEALDNYKVQEQAIPWQPPLQFEHGIIANADNNWRKIDLEKNYRSPVVIATPEYEQDSPPLVTRFRNASDESIDHNYFDFKLERLDGLTDPIKPINVHYFVTEAGIYNEAHHNAKFEAIKFKSKKIDRAGSWVGTTRPYVNNYTSPVVLGDVQSNVDLDFSIFWSRGKTAFDPPDSSTLFVGNHVGEHQDTTRSNETLGYLVFESQPEQVAGQTLLAGLGASSVQGIDDLPPFSYPIAGVAEPSVAIVKQSGMKESDGSWAVLHGPNALSLNNIDLTIDQDQLKDSERANPGEQVSYLVIDTGSGTGVLNGSVSLAPLAVDLTTIGISDWAHWGLTEVTDVDRKSDVNSEIIDYVAIGNAIPVQISNSQTAYSWNDGVVNPVTTDSSTGIAISEVGSGFELTVMADAHPRTINLYVGANLARGQFEANLSDNSAAPYILPIDEPSGISSHVVSINFQAKSAGQHLMLRYTLDTKYDVNDSWISLESASLDGSPVLNQAPIIQKLDLVNIEENQTLSFSVMASDIDGPGPLILTAVNLPGDASFTDLGNGIGNFVWTPAIDDLSNGPYNILFTATDGGGELSSTVITLIAILPNGGNISYGGTPWPVPGQIEMENYDLGGEGIAYHEVTVGNKGTHYRTDDVDIWINPIEGLYVGTNRAGEWLEYMVDVAVAGNYLLELRYTTPNTGRKIHLDFAGVNVSGAITLPSTGGWENWQTLTVPITLTETGPQIMRLSIDGSGMNLSWLKLISLGSLPTQTNNNQLALDEGEVGTITAALLQYDDIDNIPSEVVFTVTTGPSVGSFNLTSFSQQDIIDGLVAYTHGGTEVFNDSFNFTVTDGLGTVINQVFSISINPVNDNTPLVVLDSLTVTEGGTQTLLDGGQDSVLANDSDADLPGDNLVAVLDLSPAFASAFTLNSDGSFSYTHDGSTNFSDSFSYHINDGLNDSNVVSVSILVTPAGANQAPVLMPIGARSISETQLLSIPITATDDGVAIELVMAASGLPSGATFNDVGSGNGTFEWVPGVGTAGTYDVTFSVTDLSGAGLVASEIVTLTVNSLMSDYTPYGGGALWPIPGQVELENYDLGGEGVAYHDNSVGNKGTRYRTDDVDIWLGTVEGMYVGGNQRGEWLEYAVDVATAGNYLLELRYSTPNTGRKIHLDFAGMNVSGAIALPNTGGWQKWQTLTVPITLTETGPQIMRLSIDGSGMNLNWIRFQ